MAALQSVENRTMRASIVCFIRKITLCMSVSCACHLAACVCLKRRIDIHIYTCDIDDLYMICLLQCVYAGSCTLYWHTGHLTDVFSHGSMHATWKLCMQSRERTRSPSDFTSRQMEHTAAGLDELHTTTTHTYNSNSDTHIQEKDTHDQYE